MYIAATLALTNPSAKAKYDKVADLLGPIGKPALDELLEAVWFAAIDAAEDANL